MNGNYNEIARQDKKAAEVYRLKADESLSYTGIAESLGISSSLAKQLYLRAKYILDHKSQEWLEGLSRQTKQAILRAGFKSKSQLKDRVSSRVRIDGIGDKKKEEIKAWLEK